MADTSDHPDASLPAALTQALAGRYRLVRRLGQGGMATVYLAEDVRHQRGVAVKVLRPELASVLGSDRFLREITITAGLEHPHILPLLDSGSAPAEGGPEILYYVMPYVEGESLRDRLDREKQLPVDDALQITREVADALSYAHTKGVIHRDIKPENILLSGGHARVADFGIARALSASGGDRLTATGMTVGTPHYMSPEQAAGHEDLDGRSDLYALGCVLYEMLAGQPPFTGPTAQSLVNQHLTAAPQPITRIRPAVPAEVAAALERALAKTPADRFNPTAQFAEALGRRGAASAPAAAARPAWLVPGLAAAAVVVAAALWLLAGGRDLALTVGTTTQVTRDPGLEVDPALSPDGQLVAYAAGVPGHMQIFVRQVTGGRTLQLTSDTGTDHRWPRWSPEGDRIAFQTTDGIAVVPALGGQVRSLFHLPADSSSFMTGGGVNNLAGFAWSPDGKRIAIASGWVGTTRGITVISVAGGEPTTLGRVPAPHSPAWSPDGTRLAVASDNPEFVFGSAYFGNEGPTSIWIVPVDGSEPEAVVSDGGINETPQWSPDGRQLFWISSAGGGRDIYYASVDRKGRLDGAPHRLTSGTGAHSFTLSRDGRSLAYAAYRTSSNIWELPVPRGGPVTTAGARPLTSGQQIIEDVGVSPDGRWLAFSSDRTGDAEIYKMPATGGEMTQLTSEPGGDYHPNWSPDGRRIVFHSLRSGDRDVYTMTADGSDVRLVAGGPGQQLDPDWSRDGSRISFQLLEADTLLSPIAVVPAEGGEPQKYPVAGDFAFWSPTADLLALHVPGGVGILDPADGALRIVASVTEAWGQPLYAAWAPDGRSIYYLAKSARGASIHLVPLGGGPSRLLVNFDDPTRQHTRYGFDTDGKTFYFTIGSHESDIWVMELK